MAVIDKPSQYVIHTKIEYISADTRCPSPAINGAISTDLGGLPTSPFISEDSPIHSLQFLKTGWDGYWAEPLSQAVLLKADRLWKEIRRVDKINFRLPVVRPSANGSVAFTWIHSYPEKELEIWLYDRSDYYAEWMISFQDIDSEGRCRSQQGLINIIREYQES